MHSCKANKSTQSTQSKRETRGTKRLGVHQSAHVDGERGRDAEAKEGAQRENLSDLTADDQPHPLDHLQRASSMSKPCAAKSMSLPLANHVRIKSKSYCMLNMSGSSMSQRCASDGRIDVVEGQG
eukprot:1962560-Rhodomonas_salina.3